MSRLASMHLRRPSPSPAIPTASAQKAPGSQSRQRGMEPLWSPVVATGGNRLQIDLARKRLKEAKTAGKEGVDGSSPSEGSAV